MEDKIEIRMCGKWVPAKRDVALRLAKFLFVKMVGISGDKAKVEKRLTVGREIRLLLEKM